MLQHTIENKTVEAGSKDVRVKVHIQNRVSSRRGGSSKLSRRQIRDEVIPELNRALAGNTRGFGKAVGGRNARV